MSAAGGAQILCIADEKIRSIQEITVKDPTCASFYRDNARNLAVGSDSGKTYIWDTKCKNVVKTFSSVSSPVKFLDFNSKNTILATAMENGDIVLYGVNTNNQLGSFKVPYSKSVSSLTFNRDFKSVLGVATDEGSILVRDLSMSKDKMFLKTAHNAPVTGIAFSPINKDVMGSCSYDKKSCIYDIRLQTVVSTIVTDHFLSCIDISSESYVATGTKNGEIMVYDLRNYRKPTQVLKDHTTTVNRLAFQPFVPKNKKVSTFNISLKEISTPNLKSGKSSNKSPESANFSELMEHIVSPMGKCSPMPSTVTPNETDVTHDSFLANIIDQTSQSILNDSKIDELQKFRSQSHKLTPTECDKESTSISTSTPLDYINNRMIRKANNTDNTCSPILNNGDEFDMNGNSDSKSINVSQKKSIDIPDSHSAVETIKYAPNYMSNLSNELKDYIRFTTCDVLSECRNYYMSMTIEQTKNRLFLEDQLENLNQKILGLQQMQHVILEENKKLLIEVEMLRAAKKV